MKKERLVQEFRHGLDFGVDALVDVHEVLEELVLGDGEGVVPDVLDVHAIIGYLKLCHKIITKILILFELGF